MSILGIFCSFGAAIIWAGCFGMYRRFAVRISAFSLNLFKTVIGLFAMMIAVLVTRPEPPSDPSSWIHLGASGVIGLALGDIALLASLRYLCSQTAAMLFCLSPIFTIAIGYLFLGETLTASEVAGIAITLFGIFGALALSENEKVKDEANKPKFALGAALGVLSALLNALGVVFARKGFQGTDPVLGACIRLAPALLVLLIIGTFGRRNAKAADELVYEPKLPVLAATAFMGTFVAIVLASIGTKYLKAGLSATFMGSVPLWTIPLGRFFFNEKTKPLATAFIALSLVGIFFLFN